MHAAGAVGCSSPAPRIGFFTACADIEVAVDQVADLRVLAHSHGSGSDRRAGADQTGQGSVQAQAQSVYCAGSEHAEPVVLDIVGGWWHSHFIVEDI